MVKQPEPSLVPVFPQKSNQILKAYRNQPVEAIGKAKKVDKMFTSLNQYWKKTGPNNDKINGLSKPQPSRGQFQQVTTNLSNRSHSERKGAGAKRSSVGRQQGTTTTARRGEDIRQTARPQTSRQPVVLKSGQVRSRNSLRNDGGSWQQKGSVSMQWDSKRKFRRPYSSIPCHNGANLRSSLPQDFHNQYLQNYQKVRAMSGRNSNNDIYSQVLKQHFVPQFDIQYGNGNKIN